MDAFIQILSIDGVCSFSPLFGGFLLIPTRILQIVIVASLCIMLDVYSKRHEEPFRSPVFSLLFIFLFYWLLLIFTGVVHNAALK